VRRAAFEHSASSVSPRRATSPSRCQRSVLVARRLSAQRPPRGSTFQRSVLVAAQCQRSALPPERLAAQPLSHPALRRGPLSRSDCQRSVLVAEPCRRSVLLAGSPVSILAEPYQRSNACRGVVCQRSVPPRGAFCKRPCHRAVPSVATLMRSGQQLGRIA